MKTCKCHHLPPDGDFVIGMEYTWEYIIDGIIVEDENKVKFSFTDIGFLLYFTK